MFRWALLNSWQSRSCSRKTLTASDIVNLTQCWLSQKTLRAGNIQLHIPYNSQINIVVLRWCDMAHNVQNNIKQTHSLGTSAVKMSEMERLTTLKKETKMGILYILRSKTDPAEMCGCCGIQWLFVSFFTWVNSAQAKDEQNVLRQGGTILRELPLFFQVRIGVHQICSVSYRFGSHAACGLQLGSQSFA